MTHPCNTLGNETLAAFDPTAGRTVTFPDYVHEGETVAVYRTMEAAEAERGSYRMMRVVRGADDWLLEALNDRTS